MVTIVILHPFCLDMEDEKHLLRLKQNFIDSLKVDAKRDCEEDLRRWLRCTKTSFMSLCINEKQKFNACWNKRLEELKEENKELLEFKINQ